MHVTQPRKSRNHTAFPVALPVTLDTTLDFSFVSVNCFCATSSCCYVSVLTDAMGAVGYVSGQQIAGAMHNSRHGVIKVTFSSLLA